MLNLQGILEKYPKFTAEFVCKHQEEFLEFLLNREKNTFGNDLNNEEDNIPESTQLLEKAYEDAEDITIENYVRNSMINLWKDLSQEDIVEKIGNAILNSQITAEEVKNFLSKLQ